MPRTVNITFFTIALLTVVLCSVGSFITSATAQTTTANQQRLEQKVIDLESKLNDHIERYDSARLGERTANLEASVSEILWLIRGLVVAVVTELLRRLKLAVGSKPSGSS